MKKILALILAALMVLTMFLRGQDRARQGSRADHHDGTG